MNHSITESLNPPAALCAALRAGHSNSSSLWGDAWRQLRRDRIAVASFWIIVIYLAMALYGEGVFWYFHWKDMAPPYQQTNLREEYLAPSVFRHPFAMVPRADLGEVGSSAAKSVAVHFRTGLRTLAHHPLGTDNL